MTDWVIVVDDDKNVLKLVCQVLRRAGIRPTAMRSGEEALDFIGRNGYPDLVLLDANMPGTDGFATLQRMKKQMETDPENEIPIVLMTEDEEQEARGLEAGAQDIILKPFEPEVLVSRVCKAMDINRRMRRFARNAETDRMTDLPNKSATEERMDRLCDEAEGILCVLDLDNFKAVNDTFGHDVGDKVLMMFARVLKMNLRRDDECGRIGGDEFAVFLKNMKHAADLKRFTKRINDGYEVGAKAIMGERMSFAVGVSVGAVSVPQYGQEYTELFRMADQALYTVKQNGKHGAQLYSMPVTESPKAKPKEMDLETVTAMLQERTDLPGAMYTGKEIFGSIYQYMVRYMNRYRNSAFRVLLTLRTVTEVHEDERGKMQAAFKEKIRGALRGSDVMMECGENQVFLLLPGIKAQDLDRVIGRLKRRWRESGFEHQGIIESEFAPVVVERNRVSAGRSE